MNRQKNGPICSHPAFFMYLCPTHFRYGTQLHTFVYLHKLHNYVLLLVHSCTPSSTPWQKGIRYEYNLHANYRFQILWNSKPIIILNFVRRFPNVKQQLQWTKLFATLIPKHSTNSLYITSQLWVKWNIEKQDRCYHSSSDKNYNLHILIHILRLLSYRRESIRPTV
jgi:hypothetical protein